MSVMTPEQKEDRKTWRERLKYLVECSKLNHNDAQYMHVSDLAELIDDIPSWDISDSDRAKYLKLCGVDE